MKHEVEVDGSGSRWAVIFGSGMGSVRSRFQIGDSTAFAEIPGLGESRVDGHAGWIHAAAGPAGTTWYLVEGRRHWYEGDGAVGVGALVRWLAGRGVARILSFSAAGGLRPVFEPGRLVVAKGLLDVQNRSRDPGWRVGRSLTVGRGGPEKGGVVSAVLEERALQARSPGLDSVLADRVERAASISGVGTARGIVACGEGPAYESAAEVRRLAAAGADVATMSAGPELELAGQIGLAVAIVALVTNHATGVRGASPDHTEVLACAGRLGEKIGAVVSQLLMEQ